MDENAKKIKELIPARLKKATSYHSELEEETLQTIKLFARGSGLNREKARDMLKLFKQRKRIEEKLRQKGRL